jgi:Tfp pilus assembly protein PilF
MAEATSEFEDVIRRWPNHIQAHLGFGQFLVQQGLRDRAMQQFQEVLRLDPGNETARQSLDSLQNESIK